MFYHLYESSFASGVGPSSIKGATNKLRPGAPTLQGLCLGYVNDIISEIQMEVSKGKLSLYPKKRAPFTDPKSHILGLPLPAPTTNAGDSFDCLDFNNFITFARDEEVYECFRSELS